MDQIVLLEKTGKEREQEKNEISYLSSQFYFGQYIWAIAGSFVVKTIGKSKKGKFLIKKEK